MANYQFKAAFELGEAVFLNVPDSDEYLVSNIFFDALSQLVQYEILGSSGMKEVYNYLDLTRDKKF
jgi:hypothetical protein